MPVSKYGLVGEEEAGTGNPTGSANVAGGTQNQAGAGPNLNPFGAPRAVQPLGAAAVIPQVQQYAFNPKYAAQSTALEQMLSDRGLERSNQLNAIDADWARGKEEAGRSRDQALKSLINRYASSGILGSGIDAMSRGEMEGNFQRFLGDLELNRGNARQGVEGAWAQAIRNVNQERAGMWGTQQREEEEARLQQERDRAEADRQQREAAAAQQRHQEMLDAQRAAAANVPQNPGMNWPTVPGAGGNGPGGPGGGGGGGAGLTGMEAFGIGPGDTMQDIQGQINLLASMGDVHQLSLMYNTPAFNSPQMAQMKTALRGVISNMSTPGNPAYNPANSTYQQPGGFW